MKQLLAAVTIVGLLTCMFFQHTFVLLCSAKPCPPEKIEKCSPQTPVVAATSCCMMTTDNDNNVQADQLPDSSPCELAGLYMCPPRPCAPILIKPPLLMAVYENKQLEEYDYVLFALTPTVYYEEQQHPFIDHTSKYIQTVHRTIKTTILRC